MSVVVALTIVALFVGFVVSVARRAGSGSAGSGRSPLAVLARAWADGVRAHEALDAHLRPWEHGDPDTAAPRPATPRAATPPWPSRPVACRGYRVTPDARRSATSRSARAGGW